ncbi:centrosomal of 112 kDa-like [Paramuricea clavata]|uniref:Centrosomal of 112 kDa-like n=1 Tax=Paramuricea clavata TaxID=317549 RepID=A0A6S7GZJ4_PARCT|nr:centrosomal of 112 kDa-like [Paramuricea clavata]
MAASARKRDGRNVRGSSATEKLDEIFNNFVDCMKPFVLKLAKKSERQRIAMWIKKLCEPPGTSLLSRKNRNMYAQVLLAMLKRDLIEEPFSQQPEAGPLPTMPAYMSIYADDPTVQSSLSEQEVEDINTPSWIRGELESTSDSYQDDSQHERNHSRRSSSNRRTPVYESQGDENSLGSSYSGSLRNHSTASDNGELARSPYQAKRISGGKVRYEPVYLREILNSDLGYPTSTPTKAVSKMNGEHSSYLSQTREIDKIEHEAKIEES